ncbi:MAG: globin [Pseudonocardiales bacterium]|nr:globin [Jatrophihabitantaceae bacterium]MCW2603674.1 globin [Pseudonocardiales bacterium]
MSGPARRPTPEETFAAMGGEATFHALVARFYEGVAADPVLRPMYPEEDLGPAQHRLTMFLIQYWGGPPRYAQERGHPRLRMRHAPFVVGPAERDAWLSHMADALATLDLDDAPRAALWAYLSNAADALRNSDG